MNRSWHGIKILGVAFLALGVVRGSLVAGTATDINGISYTGLNSSGGLQAGGGTDSNWTVTYASVNGVSYKGNSTYTGSAYVLSSSYIDSAYVPNTTSAQWITAPGAMTAASGGTVNAGGDYLPGNGTTGINAAQFQYSLSFNIAGTGSGTVSNQVSINLTVAADDQYTIYVNPTFKKDGSVNTKKSTVSASATGAWNNTTANWLQNFTDGNGSASANFVIGTNTIVIVVNNTNSLVGSSANSSLNASGLLVYQVGSAGFIDGHAVPEMGAWLPVAAAMALFGLTVWRRRRAAIAGQSG